MSYEEQGKTGGTKKRREQRFTAQEREKIKERKHKCRKRGTKKRGLKKSALQNRKRGRKEVQM